MEGFVSDTMATVLWLEKRRMPQKAKALFLRAEKNDAKIYVPAMTLAEIGYLSEKGRIEITQEFVIAYLKSHSDNFFIHSLDIGLIRHAFEINDIPELHDRLIAASGKSLGCPVITNDPAIIASKFVRNLGVIK